MNAKSRVPSKLVEALERSGVSLAVLFGSRSSGRERPASDWDIGILASPEVDTFRLSAELGRLVRGNVDLVELKTAPPLLAMAAVREGRVLVDVTGFGFAQFASLALRRFEDNKKLLRAQRTSLRTFLDARVKQ